MTGFMAFLIGSTFAISWISYFTILNKNYNLNNRLDSMERQLADLDMKIRFKNK